MSDILQKFVTLLSFEPDKQSVATADKVLDGLKGKLIGLAAVAAPGLLLKQGWDTLKQATAAADVAAKTARSIGVTTEAYQELTYAAGLSGVKSEQLNTAMLKLGKNANQAAKGNKELRATFKGLGVDVDALAKLKPDEQLEAMAEAASKIQDPGQRNALLMKIFEEAGPKFASMFAGGAEGIRAMRKEAEELGLIISDEDAVKAEAFNDSLDRLGQMATKLKQIFLLQLLPAIQPFLNDLTKWRKEDNKETSTILEDIAKALRDLITTAHEGIKDFRELSQALGGTGRVLELFGVILGSILGARYLLLMTKGTRLLTLAQLKLAGSTLLAMLPYIALAAVILSTFLLVEDFYRFVNGEGSIFADFFGPSGQEMIGAIQAALVGVLVIVGGIALLVGSIPIALLVFIGLVIMLIAYWDEVIDSVADFFLSLTEGMLSFDEMFEELKAGFGEAFDWIAEQWDALIEWLSDKLMGVIGPALEIAAKVQGGITDNPVTRFFGGGAGDPSIDAQGQAARLVASTPQLNAPVQVNINGSGLSEAELARATANGVDEGLRATAEQFAGRAAGT